MAAIFSSVLNMSLTGSVVILFVILARLLLKRSPKIFSYALWSVVLFRLLCPVAFTAPISVLEVVKPEQKETSDNTSIVTYIPATVNTQADFIMVQPEEQPVQTEIPSEQEEQLRMTPMHAVALAWAAGTVGMVLYSVVQYLRLRSKLIGAMQQKENIYLADHIDTAFVVGLLQPKIYLPSSVPSGERYYILAHEQYHIRRDDHIIKLLAYLALCIHWFNPLAWIAFILSGKDMEMSCDEAVIKKLGSEIRADYSASLLRLTTHKKILSGMPLAFGEGDTKDRVLNMAKWKNPAKWVVAICGVLCLCIVVVCAFNPEKGTSIEEMTRRTSDGPVGTGIGDLYFTYPAGLTSEMREVENWTKEEALRSMRGLPNRGQFDCFFIDKGVDFGGVVDFLVPEDREIKLEELNLPSDWMGLDYTSGSSTYPYAEREYTLIKDGKDYIQMYLYTYSGRGYFLWFYTEQGNPVHKEAILNSVEMGGGGGGKNKLECDTPVSLGLFNITIPKGYRYYHHETVILEITQKDFWGNLTLLGCVTARPNPNLPIDSEEDLKPWVEAVGIELADEGVSHSYQISNEGSYGDVQLILESAKDSKYKMAENHYFFIAGDIVYDLYFDALKMDPETEESILKSIWIKDPVYMPAKDKWVTSLGNTPVTIGQLPDGYNYGFDGDQNIVFAWGNNAVGGVKSYPIPAGLYDPEDEYFDWLEEMGIPDYEDPNLHYLGGITSGDNGWAAEFADELDDEAKRTIHHRHTFLVVGNTLYDIWFDMLNISYDNAYEIRRAISIPQLSLEETESHQPTVPASDIETDTQLVAYGSLKMLLPSGFAAYEDNDIVVLTKDSVAVGGIRRWNYPDFQPSDIVEWAKKEHGVPIGYMSGSSAYGNMEYEIFWDGNPEGLNEEHEFFPDGDVIYDVWYDQNLISDGIAERFLKTVAINAEPNPAFTSRELEAFAKCKAVVDTVQSGSHHIAWEKFRTSSAGTSGYRVEYFTHEDNWLHETRLKVGDAGETQYRMMVDGESIYGTTGSDRNADESMPGEADLSLPLSYLGEPDLPWLSSFQWDDASVAYVDTLTDQGLETVMLRIDKPFYGYPEETQCYYVNFVFDGSGSFLRVELEAIAFRNNELWTANETETICSLVSAQ